MSRRLLFICPIAPYPIGGIKQIYRQVQVLRNLNYSAYIVHDIYHRKNVWLDINVPILYNTSFFSINDKSTKKSFTRKLKKSILGKLLKQLLVKLRIWPDINKNQTLIKQDDILIFPDYYGNRLINIYPLCKKVLYVQGWSFIFSNWNTEVSQRNDSHMNHIIVNSDYSYEYIKKIWAKIPISKVRHSINFPFIYQDEKKKMISYSSRRLPEHSKQIVKALRLRQKINDWEIIDINKNNNNIKPEDFANSLKQSAIFLSFSNNEGFGLPPAEAMKCGCIVIGYTGYGGREYFLEEFSYPIEERNILQFVKTIEEVALNYSNPDIKIKGLLASEYISQNYNDEIEKQDIIKCWEAILNNKKFIH
jgi:hypothetical protein